MSVTLYKYVSFERINVLEEGFIRFTQPSGLNDPFDIAFSNLDDLLDEQRWLRLSKSADNRVNNPSVETSLAQRISKIQEQLFLQRYGIKNLENLSHEKQEKFEEARVALEESLNTIISQGGLRTAKTEAFSKTRTTSKILARELSWITERVGVLSLTDKPDDLLMWAHYADSHQGFVIGLDSQHPFFNFRSQPSSALQKVEYVERRNVRTLIAEGDKPFRNFYLKSNCWSYESE